MNLTRRWKKWCTVLCAVLCFSFLLAGCHKAGQEETEEKSEEKKKLLARLRRIEGQIGGLEKMVENDAYCPDILMQSSAAACAIHSFNRQLLEAHIRGCVTEEIREGGEGKVDELCNMLQKLMK